MKKNILVLCVDRDDDLGKKAAIKTPLIGKEANLKAAQALGIADPTESDVNAIFGAVRLAQELKKEGKVTLATIAGDRHRDYRADRKIAEQLEKIIKEYKITHVALVTDGADDEQILPLIESRAKLFTVKTILVKQVKELEKSYYVIKELLRDPHFAKLIFGLPGVILAIYGIVNLLGIQNISLNLTFGLVGIYLVLKGFGIEDNIAKSLAQLRKTTSIEAASFPLYIGSLTMLLLGLWAGYDNIGFVARSISASVVMDSSTHILVNVASFVAGFISLFTLALVLFFIGRIGDMYYRREYYMSRKYARSIVSAFALFIVLDQLTRFVLFWTSAILRGPEVTDLLATVGFAFVLMLAGFIVIKYIYTTRYVGRNVKKGLKVRNLDGKALGNITAVEYKKQVIHFADKEITFNKIIRIGEEVIIATA